MKQQCVASPSVLGFPDCHYDQYNSVVQVTLDHRSGTVDTDPQSGYKTFSILLGLLIAILIKANLA